MALGDDPRLVLGGPTTTAPGPRENLHPMSRRHHHHIITGHHHLTKPTDPSDSVIRQRRGRWEADDAYLCVVILGAEPAFAVSAEQERYRKSNAYGHGPAHGRMTLATGERRIGM